MPDRALRREFRSLLLRTYQQSETLGGRGCYDDDAKLLFD